MHHLSESVCIDQKSDRNASKNLNFCAQRNILGKIRHILNNFEFHVIDNLKGGTLHLETPIKYGMGTGGERLSIQMVTI